MFIVNMEGAIYKAGKWLVIERSLKEEHAGGTLSLVGGKVDEEGNSLDIMERTIRREIYEEVGIEIELNPQFLYSSSFVLDDGRHVINVVFLCEYDQGTAYPKSQDEVEAVYWMTSDEIIDHPKVTPWLIESIERAEKQRAATL
ncbi:NUDIX domain-containing protein [Paenibacillus psychroresistens]|uniref:NUDIX domain-containing protein n=1 Tax=Paenibacillus psychroresistens TaxID=1778678 RepID=A0A6B8RTC0_9BACL|nr:NUDIX domain-containing protein [Paenibacillus psychroresistens]QGQ98703.1 NUDIX domain-containing protein [Paenibacillus psychroresistens]